MNEKLKKEINKTTDLISSLIHEYLYKKEYTKTLDVFQKELSEKIKSGKFYTPPSTVGGLGPTTLISFFKSGDKKQFMYHWSRLIPNNLILTESTLFKLNFNIQIYFAIYPILNPKVNITDEKIKNKLKQNMEEFKLFLEQNKSETESEFSSEFLSYYALPYIPDPRNNINYINLFKPEWSKCLIEQIEKCVEYYSPNNVSNLPILYDMTRGKKVITINNNINNNLKKYNNKYDDKKMKDLIKENKELIDRDENNKKIFVESQKNWCSLALDIINCSFDLLEVCNKLTNNQKFENIEEINSKLIKYQNFLVSNLSDLEKNKISASVQIKPAPITTKKEPIIIPERNTSINNNNTSISINMNSSLSNTIKKKSNNSISIKEPKPQKKIKLNPSEMKNSILNMKKLNLILNSKHPVYNEKISHLFKEIREKIYSKDSAIRLITLYQIFYYDILGTLTNNSIFKQLLSNKNINLELMKLVNSLSNYTIGKNYLLSKNSLISDIFKYMITENTDTPLRQNCLGTLQKFSLRTEAQNKLIELNIIHYLIDLFLYQSDTLSDYTIEYGLALLMNLSLRKEGKEKFEAVGEKIINIVTKFMKYENIEILTCINGILFSLLKKPKIKKLVQERGLGDKIQQLKNLKNEQIIRQINCIQEELNKPLDKDSENLNDKDDLFTEEDINVKDNFDIIYNEYPESKVYNDIYMEKHYKILDEFLIKPNTELENEEKIKIKNFMNENLNMTKVLLMTNSYRSNDSEENLNINNNKRIKTEENYDEDDLNKKENNSGIIITDYNNVNNDFDNIYGKPDDGFAFKTNDKIRRTPPRLTFQSLDDIYGKSSGEHPFKTKDKIRRTPPRYNFQRNIFK